MNNFRKMISELCEGFLDASLDRAYPAFIFFNVVVISIIALSIILASIIFVLFDLYYICSIIITIVLALYLFFLANAKAFNLLIPFSMNLLIRLFGKYGRVVTKNDWNRIKKEAPKVYKDMWSKKAIGHCYQYSLFIALFLEDAQLMYCSFTKSNGNKFAHAVVVKNNCVYCTNLRRHFNLTEYKQIFRINIYKVFSKNEYSVQNFIDSIREDFIKWCDKNNVYCPTN